VSKGKGGWCIIYNVLADGMLPLPEVSL